MAQTLGSFKNDFIWGGRWYYPRLVMEMTMDGKRCISISESGDENAIANKSKIHVRGELILFCLSTPKFMHFAYLSLQTFVYKNQYVFYSLTLRRKVCHFLGGDMGGRWGWGSKVMDDRLLQWGWGSKSTIFAVTSFFNGLLIIFCNFFTFSLPDINHWLLKSIPF